MLMPSRGEHLEHARRDAGVRAHAEADDRHLGDVERRPRDALRADLARDRLDERAAPCRSRPRGTVKVRSVVPSALAFWMIMSTTMLAPAIGPKSCAATPGRSGTPQQRELRLVPVVGDAGDRDLLHARILLDDPGALGVVERRAHVDRHAVALGELDGADLQHLGAEARQLEHLVVGDALELARAAGTMRGSLV